MKIKKAILYTYLHLYIVGNDYYIVNLRTPESYTVKKLKEAPRKSDYVLVNTNADISDKLLYVFNNSKDIFKDKNTFIIKRGD